MKQRDLTFDIARALCIIWIIGVWHVFDYIEYNVEVKKIMQPCTNSVLACFTFISGFFLGKKSIGIGDFFFNRFIRIYPLFFVACTLLLFIGWFNSFRQYIFTLTGLSNFILPEPSTLWYICMMLLLYFVTPLLIYKTEAYKKNPSIIILIRGFEFVALLFVLLKFNLIDSRIPFYSFFYILGVSTPLGLYERLMHRRWNIFFVCTLFYIIYFCFGGLYVEFFSFLSLFLTFIGVLLLIGFSSILSSVSGSQMNRFFSYISYASMCAYLFHRLVYWVIGCFVRNSKGYIDVFWIPAIVLMILFISFIIQRVYDKYIIVYLMIKGR